MSRLAAILLLSIYLNVSVCVLNYLSPTKDTFISEPFPNSAYGNFNFTIASNEPNVRRFTFVEYNVNAYASKCVSDISIYWFPVSSQDAADLTDPSTTMIHDLVVPSSWSESITFNTRDNVQTYASNNGVYFASASPGFYYHMFSVANIRRVMTEHSGILSVRISPQNTRTTVIDFYTNNHPNASVRPYVKVVHETCSINADCNSSGLCVCRSGFTGNGITCVDASDCDPNPCMNSGKCTDTGTNSYSCSCPAGFNGKNCQNNINDCSPNPCVFGTCVDLVNGYSCNCSAGYSGINCTTNIDDCSPNPCSNGGTCNDQVNNYTCSCPQNYSGKNCQIFTNSCSGNPCQNGATCFNEPNTYRCECLSGFNGVNCENNINDCTVNSCQNNGKCIDGVNNFSCDCTGTGFDGPTCSSNIDDCPNNSCTNGATCVDQVNQYGCSCKLGYSGKFCEINNNECEGVVCQNAGKCVDLINSFSCSCAIGWTGTFCETIVECPLLISENSQFPKTQAGKTLNGNCLPGYTGSPSRSCLMPSSNSSVGIWSALSNPCIQLFCDEIRTESMIFGKTEAGKNATTTCLSTFGSTGTPTRACLSDGAWSTEVYNSCEPLFCNSLNESNAFWAESRAGLASQIVGVCQPGYAGSPLRSCNSFGVWSQISNECTLSLYSCEPEEYENAKWGRVRGGEVSTSLGCNLGYQGNPTRECNSTGYWTDVILSSPCLPLPMSPFSLSLSESSSNSLTISWESDETKFDILVSSNGKDFFPANQGKGLGVETTNFRLTGLEELSQYSIRVYSVNSVGRSQAFIEAQYRTDLAPPTNILIPTANLTSTSAVVRWQPVSLAVWYHIFIEDGQNSKRIAKNGFRFVGNEFQILELNASTDYTVTIHSGMGEVYYEPRGGSNTFSTRPETNQEPTVTSAPTSAPTFSPTSSPTITPTDSPTSSSDNSKNDSQKIMIIGIAVGVGLCLICVLLAIVFFLAKRKKKSDHNVSHANLINLEVYSTMARASSSEGDTTLMNTVLEIALPGFLIIDCENQLRKEEKIGEGGFSAIYKGVITDPELAKRSKFDLVAIKEMFKLSSISDEQQILTFKQEVSVMWSLNFHPNVIKLVGYSEKPLCIVTKLYDRDLSSLVYNRSIDFPPQMAHDILKDIASGMSAIHSLQIIHRDLKTGNVLLETEREGGKVRIRGVICDFGISKIITSTYIANQKFVDLKGMSPRYTAPEVFTRHMIGVETTPEIEMKGDIYSFSIIIWELLSRQKPWEDLKVEEIESKVRSGERPSLEKIDSSSLPVSYLLSIAKACWKEEPTERPSFKDIFSKL